MNLAGHLNAVVTVTDGDDDVATDTVGIGAAISFEDDGPTASIDLTRALVTLDESVGERPADSNGNPDLNDTADDISGGNPDPFAGLYGTPIGAVANVALVTPVEVGEDDEGATTAVTLQIVGGSGSDSGLNTTDGTQIDLFLEANGDVTGRVGGAAGTVIFAISIDSNGNVTVAQYGSLEHPDNPDNYDEAVNLAGHLNAVVTVTDGDRTLRPPRWRLARRSRLRTTAPSVEISADTTVGAATDTADTVAEDGADLTGAITLVEGADQDATLVVSLTGATGGPLTFTLDGTAQSQSATVTQGADELGVLTIAIAAGGTATWTFNPTPDSTGNPSFSFTATVTDADGDVDADTHTISITDGAPPTSTGTLALVVDEKDLADGTTAGGNAGGDPDTQDIETGGLVFTSGSDAIASIKFDLAAGQPTTGTGLDGSITWALSVDGLTLTGSIGGDGGDHAGPVGPADGGRGRRRRHRR